MASDPKCPAHCKALTNSSSTIEGLQAGPGEFLSTDALQPVVSALQMELQALNLRRADILARIAMIKQTMIGLAELFGTGIVNSELQALLSPQAPIQMHPGLTDLCRQFLSGRPSDFVTPQEILGHIRENHPTLLVHSGKPAHSLKVSMKRLVICGEVVQVVGKGLLAWRARSEKMSSGDIARQGNGQAVIKCHLRLPEFVPRDALSGAPRELPKAVDTVVPSALNETVATVRGGRLSREKKNTIPAPEVKACMPHRPAGNI